MHHESDLEERDADADAVVAELEVTDQVAERRWHDHPAVVPVKAVGLFIGRNGKRVAITIAGVVLIIVGVAMLVLPGPGLVVIFLGLSILATTYVWAERLLNRAKEKASRAKDTVLGKKQRPAESDPDA
jgi:hypothetical protein